MGPHAVTITLGDGGFALGVVGRHDIGREGREATVGALARATGWPSEGIVRRARLALLLHEGGDAFPEVVRAHEREQLQEHMVDVLLEGLGLGGSLSLDPYGLEFERPVALMRDAIRTASAAMEARDGDGYRLMTHAAPARQVPIFLAAKGEQLNRLAGREADGVFLSGFRLDEVGRAVGWAREAGRPVHVALYASVRFRSDAPDDPTALCGDPEEVARGLVELVELHRPDSIGMALIDGDDVGVMLERAVDTLGHYRRLSTRG